MSSLTRLAFEVLEDPLRPSGLRSVACQTLLHALDDGISVPNGAHFAVWQFLLLSDGGAAHLHRHSLQHPEVAADAIRVLLDPETGEGEQDLALAALRDANLSILTEAHVVTIADRALSEGRARQIGFLLDRVHEQRGLSPSLIVALRDRLAGSDAASVRTVAVDACGLLPALDEIFVARMLRDPSPAVRSATADLLERSEGQDRPRALVLLRTQLATEQHRTVISACFHALGSLIGAGGHGPRDRDATPSTEH
jgi:hypothetical protein